MVAQSRLLTLPTELRLLIIDHALAAIPRIDWGVLDGNSNMWLPPAFVNTCRQLRMEGLQAFFEIDVCFEVYNIDMTKVLRQQKWQKEVCSYYEIKLQQWPSSYYNITNSIKSRKEATENLWTWLDAFYAGQANAQFLDGDVPGSSLTEHIDIEEVFDIYLLEQ